LKFLYFIEILQHSNSYLFPRNDILAILRYNEDTPEPVMLCQATKLDDFGFFQRGTVKEMITFFSKTITKRTPQGSRQSVQNEDYYVHVYMRSDGLCGCVTCDKEYPARVAFSLLSKILEDFDVTFAAGRPNAWRIAKSDEAIIWPPLDTMITKYQNPAEADQISRIQKNLDETREVLHNTIDSVLQRGEKLEDLVERSGELSTQSKLFYKQAKRANSCCAVV
jgi:synaptobrevin family protein YKT6